MCESTISAPHIENPIWIAFDQFFLGGGEDSEVLETPGEALSDAPPIARDLRSPVVRMGVLRRLQLELLEAAQRTIGT